MVILTPVATFIQVLIKKNSITVTLFFFWLSQLYSFVPRCSVIIVLFVLCEANARLFLLKLLSACFCKENTGQATT